MFVFCALKTFFTHIKQDATQFIDICASVKSRETGKERRQEGRKGGNNNNETNAQSSVAHLAMACVWGYRLVDGDGGREAACGCLTILYKALRIIPTKRSGQGFGANRRVVAQCHLCEQRLQLVGDAIYFCIVSDRIVFPSEQGISKFWRHEQCLQETVHVTRCALVVETTK